MKYMLIHCVDESIEVSPEEDAEIQRTLATWLDDLMARGIRSDGNRLRPVADATTVRVNAKGDTVVMDGPFAETKEQIGGYDIIDCANLDEAIEIASRHPCARLGMTEVRPFWEQ